MPKNKNLNELDLALFFKTAIHQKWLIIAIYTDMEIFSQTSKV